MLLTHLAIGGLTIAVTVVIHATFMAVALGRLRRRRPIGETRLHRAVVVTGVVLWFFLSICLQCWVWAGLLLALGALEGLEPALYFATATFTTLGYGDIVLSAEWRLLASFASTNGMIIIGWTSALVFVVVQQEYIAGDHPLRR